jgi:hypothetical protein
MEDRNERIGDESSWHSWTLGLRASRGSAEAQNRERRTKRSQGDAHRRRGRRRRPNLGRRRRTAAYDSGSCRGTLRGRQVMGRRGMGCRWTSRGSGRRRLPHAGAPTSRLEDGRQRLAWSSSAQGDSTEEKRVTWIRWG